MLREIAYNVEILRVTHTAKTYPLFLKGLWTRIDV
jgi:hypothetical protein